MEWYNIIIGFLGGGVVSGIISLYNAKPKKDSIEIANMKEMLDEAHKMFDASQRELSNYKAETNKYIAEFKDRFAKLEKRLDKSESDVLDLKGVIYHGYKCKFPHEIKECPVVAEYESKFNCDKCKEEQ
jgi:uncharacterized membrane-anchored protein YhcB (DUF1043 family)